MTHAKPDLQTAGCAIGSRYATDLTDAEFALIEPFLPPPRPGGRSRTTSLREVLNAILYVLRSG